MDVGQRRAAQSDGRGHVKQAALHEHDVGCVDGHVRAGADGDADIRLGERRGVVDAVAHHEYLPSALQAADDALLAIGQDPGDHCIHTRLVCDGLGGTLVVAGEHHHADAHIPQLFDRAGGVLLHHVRHGDDAEQVILQGKEQRRFALGGKRLHPLTQFIRNGKLPGDIAEAAAVEPPALEPGLKAIAGQGVEVCDLAKHNGVLLRPLHDGTGQRMLALLFEGVGCLEEDLLLHPGGRDQIRHLGLALGDGAGFVERDDLHLARLLQRHGGFEEDAVFGAKAIANHDGNRGRQAQRARAGDHKHRNPPGKRIAEFLADKQPHGGSHKRDCNDRGDEDAGDLVRDFGNGRLGRGGVADHFDDLAERGVLPHAGGSGLEIARLVHRSG